MEVIKIEVDYLAKSLDIGKKEEKEKILITRLNSARGIIEKLFGRKVDQFGSIIPCNHPEQRLHQRSISNVYYCLKIGIKMSTLSLRA